MIEIINQTDNQATTQASAPIDTQALESMLNHALEKSAEVLAKSNIGARVVEVVLVDSADMRALNAEYMGKDYATDVLSFPLEDMLGEAESANLDSSFLDSAKLASAPTTPLGSIIINLDLAREMSENLGHSIESEIGILFVHALLHLLGFDHECDSGEHRTKEREIITALGLPPSLIERNS
ncbi:rRNA maturation RNase YbeY [Helicobacter sp. CLO-3]|uniref:rRNA maturation RNase YbeY n=1 Tax=unclassified Helicobacter TaxID=2593540 RepID=UPI000804BF0E|nr:MULTISPECIES: rRNA maturation RNase YbeY [unclassified Helicobacter]OBV28510.1 rRNA maturation RNase YbeY [Helicobacter sp. CLO-3]OHU84177.1 rRNA maturation RNase YbeY [Helicobacter sp. CLO-3]